MLGEKIYEITGKVIGQRVLPTDNSYETKLEISYQGSGKLLGLDVIDNGTYVASMKAPGILEGVGHGLVLTKDGEAVAWHGTGVGKPTGKGMGASWRGSILFSTHSEKLARLNGVAVVFEWDVDENGNAKGGGWEWR